MRKEEILAINKKTGIDEREKTIESDSSKLGLITVLAMVIFIDLWKWFHGIKSYELSLIFGGYITTTCFYKYRKLGKKRYLIASIFAGIATLIAIAAFILGN